jgi:magnesium transporter
MGPWLISKRSSHKMIKNLQEGNKMREPIKKFNKLLAVRRKKIGLPPGSPVYTGEEKKDEEVCISILDFNEDSFEEKHHVAVEDICAYIDTPSKTWINIDGIHSEDIIKKIGEQFGIHPLILEDIMNPNQRAKLDEHEHHIYLVMKMLSFEEDDNEVKGEQISLVLGDHYVISFQERPGDIFNIIRERIRKGKGRIRKMGADYLAYSLVDTIVDNYFLILEKLGEKIEVLENSLEENPGSEILHELHYLKKEMIYLRKSVWPLREVVNNFERIESGLIKKPTKRYLRDVYDHTIQVIDAVEAFKETLMSLHDAYLSQISYRLNSVMKVLTIIATIFIPLTFIAGIYGMNFKYMPELGWRWGYPFAGIIMLAVVLVMLIFFKKKKWI